MPKSTTPSTTPSRSQETPSKGTRILLVEDHAVLREALRLLLESQPGLKVVGEANNRTEALSTATQEQPDIILLDIQLSQEISLDFLPDLLAAAPQAKVIVLTASAITQDYRRALALGARGIVLKEQASAVLLRAIERVRAGELWVEPTVMASLVAVDSAAATPQADPEAANIATLTAQEREVIALVGEGLQNPQIATRLFVSERTVRRHLTSIFNKLGVADRSKLLIYAYRHGLTK